jgi:hypothetical protein
MYQRMSSENGSVMRSVSESYAVFSADQSYIIVHVEINSVLLNAEYRSFRVRGQATFSKFLEKTAIVMYEISTWF